MLLARDAVQLGDGLDDDAVIDRVRAGDLRFFEVLMRRHNQRIFRAARAVVHDEVEAEEIMQDTYVRAFTNLHQFEGRASFATWLTRIAVHAALARRRMLSGWTEEDESDALAPESVSNDPERATQYAEMESLFEAALERLAPKLRAAFVLREVQGMSSAETADALGIREDAVKVRVHRARAFLQDALRCELGSELADVYSFHLVRCDRVVLRAIDAVTSIALDEVVGHALGAMSESART
jgi:RNA polymerase sigma-70 factor (ECF subfamily)